MRPKRFVISTLLAALMATGAAPAVAQDASASEALTLETVLERVEAQNEEWEITEARIAQARAIRRQALAALLPVVSISASGTRNGEEISVAGSQVRPQYDWSAAGRASVMVFDGTMYPMLSRAGELLEAQKALAKWQRLSVLFEAKQAFYLLAAAQDLVDIAERTVELRQAQLARAEALVEAGEAVRLDVERALAQFLQAKQDLLVAQAQRGNADDALASLLAEEPQTEVRVQVADQTLDQPPSDAALDEIERRADFEAFERQIEAVELQKDSAWMSLLPIVELRADARLGPETAFSNPDGFTWSMTLSATWLLYDGGARWARIDQFEAQVEEEELQYKRQLRQAKVGVRQALRDWRSAAAAVEVARQQVEAAGAAYESAQARFEQGLANSIDVADASEALFRAETALNQRVFEARTAAAEYRYLVDVTGYGE